MKPKGDEARWEVKIRVRYGGVTRGVDDRRIMYLDGRQMICLSSGLISWESNVSRVVNTSQPNE